MTAARHLWPAVLCWLATQTVAQDLPFPAAATVTDQQEQPAGTLAVATGPWSAATGTPLRSLTGDITQTAYRMADSTLSTPDILSPLRSALLASGFGVVYECAAVACGGFDFRYDLPVLPEPAMHVDLGDYLYFAATRQADDGQVEAVMLIISRAANAGFVQVNRIGGATSAPQPLVSATSAPLSAPAIAPVAVPAAVPAAAPAAAASVATTPRATAGDIGALLKTSGALPLDDLIFPSGASALAPGDYASLASLASFLAANPTRQIAIVGHTDASGGLDGNITLSRRRAESVRRTLIDELDVTAGQVIAEGVGYLSPRASNLTPEGRTANRRVEVMLVTIE